MGNRDILVVGVLAIIGAFFAYRTMRMTTGKAAQGPLNKTAFFRNLIIMGLVLGASIVIVLIRTATGNPTAATDKELDRLRKRVEEDVLVRESIEAFANRLRRLPHVAGFDPGLVPSIDACAVRMAAKEGEVAATALELAKQRFKQHELGLAPWLELHARCFAAQGKFDEVEWPATQALKFREREFGKESPEVVDAIALLAEAACELGRLEEAEKLCKRGMGLTDRMVGLLPSQTPRLLWTMAAICEKTNRPEEARSYLNRARSFGAQK